MSIAYNGQHHAVNEWRREHFARGVPRDVTLTERKLWQTNPADHDFRAQYLHEMPDWLSSQANSCNSSVQKCRSASPRRVTG